MDLATITALHPQTKLFVEIFCFLCPAIIFVLVKMLRKMINEQIDEQMKKMIPLKGVRNLIDFELKWR